MVERGSRASVRQRVVESAVHLLQQEGAAAVTTRGVAGAAGVQAPAIYRLFGDKDGLLEAVLEHVLAAQVAAKAEAVELAADDADPVDELRASWSRQIEFGLANPAVFQLLSDPGRVSRSPAARSGRAVLEGRIRRIAAAGRLRVTEQQAIDMVQAAGTGTIQTLLAAPPDRRDPGLAAAMLDAVLDQVLTDDPARGDHGPLAAAVALRALAPRLDALTGAERGLLLEWTDRLIDAGT